MSHEVWRHLAKHPTRSGGEGEGQQAGVEEKKNHTRVVKSQGVESHQLSGFSCVSMSTRQIGHFLLVASHWSTQPWWKRCMQGNLLEDRETEEHGVTHSLACVTLSDHTVKCLLITSDTGGSSFCSFSHVEVTSVEPSVPQALRQLRLYTLSGYPRVQFLKFSAQLDLKCTFTPMSTMIQ